MIDLFASHPTEHDHAFEGSFPAVGSGDYHPLSLDDSGDAYHHHTGEAEHHPHHPYPEPHEAKDSHHWSVAAQSAHDSEYVHVSHEGGTLYGEPVHDFTSWHHQAGHSSCAVVAQMGVYESVTHRQMTEQQFCDFAQAHGWYDPRSGTPPQCMGNVLNALGIPAEQHHGGSLTELADALGHGDKVIVGLNANEIWHAAHSPDGTPMHQPMAGHAVWVTGLNVAPDGTATVYLNDSGTAHGAMMAVDARDFVNAWQDFGNLTVIAHAA